LYQPLLFDESHDIQIPLSNPLSKAALSKSSKDQVKVCINNGLFKSLDQKMALVKKIMNQLKPIQRQTNLIIKTIAPIDAFAA
jgi:hypothetical protein